MERRRFKQETPLDQRLEDHAKRLRKEAKGTPAGIKRDDLIRRARQAETTRMSEWLTSPGLQAQVNEYRAFTVGHDGHVTASRAFVCANDEDAIVWTKQLVDGYDVELWSGDRFIIKIDHQE